MNCFAKAVATVLNKPIQNIYNFCGHDGSKILWPENPSPYNQRGFSDQELISYCLSIGYAMIPFYRGSKLIPFGKGIPHEIEVNNLYNLMLKYNGILYTPKHAIPHKAGKVKKFTPKIFFVIVPLHITIFD